MSSNWEQLAADKRTRISKSIPSEWVIKEAPKDVSAFDYAKSSGLLSAQELEWTNSTATELVAQLATGQLKSVDVTLAFCKRAALAQQLVRHHSIILGSLSLTRRLISACRQIVYTSSSQKLL
jgi:amidase